MLGRRPAYRRSGQWRRGLSIEVEAQITGNVWKIEVKVGELRWKIIREMLRVSEEVYRDLETRREARKASPATPSAQMRAQERLRVRDHW